MERARHEFLDHTAELALRLHAPTPAELFAEACRAVGLLVREETGARIADGAEVRTLTVEAVDAEALLVDLLNELVYVAETEQWAPVDARTVAWSPARVTLELGGVRLPAAPSRIKSATHHGLTLRRAESGWTAEVIFDV